MKGVVFMIWKRIVASVLVVCITFGALPNVHNRSASTTTAYAAETYSGSCGENVKWLLNGNTLIISGTGAMTDYTLSTDLPYFNYLEKIKTVIIKDGVTTIGNGAFYECTNVTSVTIPESVQSIGISAFQSCISLKNIALPKNLKSLGYDAFFKCLNLQSIVLPDGIETIGKGTFYNCTNLTSVSLPNSLKTIDTSAFQFCSSLTSINIPDSVTSLGDDVFYECTELSSIKLSSKIDSLGVGLFYKCESLEHISIPRSVSEIKDYAFAYSGISEVSIPYGVTTIGEMAFYDCPTLKSVAFPETINEIKRGAFAYCTQLENAVLPTSLLKIYGSAFEKCERLVTFEIPSNVEYIGMAAFYTCNNLQSISILNPNCEIYDGTETFAENTILVSDANSTAFNYAQKHSRKFVELSSSLNSIYNFNDERENLIALQSFLLTKPYYGKGKVIDVNEDGCVDVFDLCLAKRAYMNAVNEIYLKLDGDGNGWPDCLESDDHTTDTDGDGLSDYDELMYTNTSPVLPDSDDNGISDSFEDPDEDGINNIVEISLGTNPLLADSDFDGLTDDQEIALGTDPMLPDTDEDGAEDGWEIDNGYDPLTFNKSFEVTAIAETPEITASATINGNGAISTSLEVEPVEGNILLNEDVPGYIGSAFNFSTNETFDSATISFDFDENLLSDSNFTPAIYYYNEETQMLEELETTTSGHTAYAIVPHFSTYMLLNKTAFDEVWTEEIRELGEAVIDSSMSVFFVLDRSGSMVDNDPNRLRYSLANEYIQCLDSKKDFAGIITYNGSSTIVSALTNDFAELNNKINAIGSDSGGTDGTSAINTALSELSKDKSDNNKYIIFMTDGDDPDLISSQESVIKLANSYGVIIYTIRLGDVNESALRAIANETKGRFFTSDDASGLVTVFKQAQAETIDYRTDSNNDGISDYYTKLISENKLRTGTGTPIADGYSYDELQASDDWDNDGKLNGEEVTVTATAGKVRVSLSSSPLLEDSDMDGIWDQLDSSPLQKGILDKSGSVKRGELLLVSTKGDDIPSMLAYVLKTGKNPNNTGHSFLVYHSYIEDELDLSCMNRGFSKGMDDGFWHSSTEDSNVSSNYKIGKDEYITLGAGGLTEQDAKCAVYNMELWKAFSLEFKEKNDCNYSYTPNAYITNSVTMKEWKAITAAFAKESQKTYDVFSNNCTDVALNIWNETYKTNYNPVGLNTPRNLYSYLSKIQNVNYNLTMLSIVDLKEGFWDLYDKGIIQ